MKEIILRDAKMCAYAAGNVEHFKYLMKRLGYVFKKDAWMEVQAPGFRYYHKLAKLDEMFSENMLRHYVEVVSALERPDGSEGAGSKEVRGYDSVTFTRTQLFLLE